MNTIHNCANRGFPNKLKMNPILITRTIKLVKLKQISILKV